MDEPGSDEVEQILSDDAANVLVASVTIAEFARRLWTLGDDSAKARETTLSYLHLFERVVSIDVAVSTRAFKLATIAAERIPLIDALIAAAAQTTGAKLAHRDHRFRSIAGVEQWEIGKDNLGIASN